MNLFQLQKTILNSGQKSDFKIECDALTDEDIECCAYLISKRVAFRLVFGVPTGGTRLAQALKKYSTLNYSLPTLIVDDVLTTGHSMNVYKVKTGNDRAIGFVIFSRGICPSWITPLFQINL